MGTKALLPLLIIAAFVIASLIGTFILATRDRRDIRTRATDRPRRIDREKPEPEGDRRRGERRGSWSGRGPTY
jgi:hypothetical protein